MAHTLSQVVLTAPAGNESHAAGATFTMTMHTVYAGSGAGINVVLYWQYDQGTGTWIDIPTSGTTGLVADASWQDPAIEGGDYSRTITCKTGGPYVIRGKGESSTPATVYSTNTPTITITTSALKTLNGLEAIRIQTKNGLAVASVKTWNGLT